MSERKPILDINMQSNMIDCTICGEPDYHYWGVPTYNGDIVSNDFPDDMGWAGVAVCEKCYNAHAAGKIPTFDHHYVKRGPLGVGLKDGAGI